MAERTDVCALADLAPGERRVVRVDGADVLLLNVAGAVHAVGAECSHEGAPLVEGELDEGTLECPWHFSRFCVRTGEALDLPATDPVRTYRVDVVDGRVLVLAAAG